MSVRDHGGDLGKACERFGGEPGNWLDLSTGINPVAYPLPKLDSRAWQALPGSGEIAGLERAAQEFWAVPERCEVVAAGGASALIAALPKVMRGDAVHIPGPTYNEYAAAFSSAGWPRDVTGILVAVHPNNPDGRLWQASDFDDCTSTIIDESFADVLPDGSLVELAERREHVVLKSFGKFWGLAGLRLGFAICLPDLAEKLRAALGPWAVSGPAVQIGAAALSDREWAHQTRARLRNDRLRLDAILGAAGMTVLGGTDLFVLFQTRDAQSLQAHLASHKIWSRVFPYDDSWMRLGLPGSEADWRRLEVALEAWG